MLELYYVRPDTVDRIRSSWISGAIEGYVGRLSENEYSFRTVSRRVPLLVRFGDYARERGAQDLAELPSHLESFVAAWLRERGREKSKEQRRKIAESVRNPIQQMLRLALPEFVGLGRTRRPENPFEKVAPGFFGYLRREKGLRPSTLRHYSHFLRKFADYLRSIGLENLGGELSPPVLSGFVTDLSRRVRWASLRNGCGVLRVWLRYLYRERLLERDFSVVVDAPQRYRLSHVPRSISWEEVRRMLEAVDRRTPVGRRDYAILLLLVTYGLRSCEVASLTLDHIDWRRERLRVPERKAGHCTIYPLSSLVGQALLDYLRTARPKTAFREVFLRHPAPRQPLSAPAISGRAAHYLHKAGIAVPRPGSHTLRHTCVQRLVDAELSLRVIGDYLGHRSPSSTQIYTKVALEALREVALGHGEEVL